MEIGTGSGYQSALLAELVSEVCSVEVIESLSLSAQKALRSEGYKNIYFRIGDGHSGGKRRIRFVRNSQDNRLSRSR